MRAGARGGARVGTPRWARILTMTAGSSMAAMSVKAPPHCGQVVMSMAKTRLSNWAQLMRARVEAEERLPIPIGGVWRLVGLTGNNLGPQRGIGGEHAMEANEMKPRTRDEGRQALQEFQRGHDPRAMVAA